LTAGADSAFGRGIFGRVQASGLDGIACALVEIPVMSIAQLAAERRRGFSIGMFGLDMKKSPVF
jgi:hypothetical protein